MFEALAIGATGMQAQQLNVETIANNLTNANTTAYKKSRVRFSELMTGAAQETRTAAGVMVAASNRIFDAAELKKTDAPLDLAIRGDGFIEVTMPDGTAAFTRGGTLKLNKDGLLASQTGLPLRPSIRVPDNAESITISADGKVSARLPNQTNAVELGQLDIMQFANPSQLTVLSDNLYRANDASGEPRSSRAGEDGAGTLAQGFLEGSNVKLVDEMVNLTLAQRGYEASVKLVQAADEMLGMTNNLRK